MAILKLDKHDEKREIEFDVSCNLKFTPAQRWRQIINLSKMILKMASQYETRRTPQIIKRPAR